jgi:hypothetical protein
MLSRVHQIARNCFLDLSKSEVKTIALLLLKNLTAAGMKERRKCSVRIVRTLGMTNLPLTALNAEIHQCAVEGM